MLRRSACVLQAAKERLRFGRRGACAIPHPEKAYRGGEDAYFAHPLAIGVADGVGGYASHGIDPALYTRNVMRFCLESVEQRHGKAAALQAEQAAAPLSALHVLEYGSYKARQAGQPGGCPATVVGLVEDGGVFASILNLGDCGTMVVRDRKLLFRSNVQQHRFNCPYQLPEDPPSAGEQAKLEVRAGDIFMCVSDGVLDNVVEESLLKHLWEVTALGCTRVAEAIGVEAAKKGRDRTFMSPFALHAKECGYQYMGGKLDDVTVLVAQVTEADVADDCCPPLITQLLGLK